VFVHSGPRTGSTYIFGKFRAKPRTMCWYEPFLPDLATATRAWLESWNRNDWDSGHPDMAPYCLEYLPLLRSGGVGIRRFRPDFADAYFFRTEGDLPEQYAHLKQLNDHARSRGRQSVLGFCRSLGRVPWLKRRFPDAVHVLLLRDPVQQWLSGRYKVASGIVEFVVQSLRHLQEPGDNAFIRSILEENRAVFESGNIPETFAYEAFLYVHGAAIAQALPLVDLVIDIDRMSDSQAYRTYVTERLCSLTGLAIDFGDCHVGMHPLAGITAAQFAEINTEVVRRLLDAFGPDGRTTSDYDRRAALIVEKIEMSLPNAQRVAAADSTS